MRTPEALTPDSRGGVARASGESARGAAPGRGDLARLAQEFEATLMNEMLSTWRQSLIADDEESGGHQGILADTVGSEFGRALSRSGGLGIADVLIRALQRQYGGAGEPHAEGLAAAPTDGAPALALAPPVASTRERHAEAASGVAPDRVAMAIADAPVRRLAGAVTSGFGWRSDPLSGQMKFHAGADVRMAYGQDVSTIAAGRVTFAGDRAGYGLTVVVDHDNGLETRYAHLSSTAVRVGDMVEAGGVIARSGNSGRSTGPHLHVELLRHGRPVDPSSVLAALSDAPKVAKTAGTI